MSNDTSGIEEEVIVNIWVHGSVDIKGANPYSTGKILEVISGLEPYSKENKSKWQIVNWYRKLTGTYYESGYKYTVKIIDNGQ